MKKRLLAPVSAAVFLVLVGGFLLWHFLPKPTPYDLPESYVDIPYPEYDALSCVTLGPYYEIKLQLPEKKVVTEQNSQEMLYKVLMTAGLFTERTDLPVARGDGVKVSLNAEVYRRDDPQLTPFETDYVVLSSEDYPPEVMDAMQQMSPGDVQFVDVTFPDDYEDESYRGLTAEYRVELLATMVAPDELTDEMAQKASDGAYQTIDELKDALTESAKKANADAWEEKYIEARTEAVKSIGTVTKFPEDLIIWYRDTETWNLWAEASVLGASLEDECELKYGYTTDEYRELLMEKAPEKLEYNLILEAIASKERLKVDDAYYEANLERLADELGYAVVDENNQVTGYETDNMVAFYGENQIRLMILRDMAEEWLDAHMTIEFTS